MNDYASVTVAPEICTVVDRTGLGGTEFIYDGVRFVLAPGETELQLLGFVAEHIFTTEQTMVWTDDGRYTNRFGLKAGPNSLADRLGPDAIDCSPITLSRGRVEGWNAEEADPDRRAARVLTSKDDPRLSEDKHAFMERHGAPADGTFGGRK